MRIFREKDEINELFKDFDTQYHWKHFNEALLDNGYSVVCLKIKKAEDTKRIKIVEEC